MPSKRYQLFKKSKSFNYKFLGQASGMNGNMAIKTAKKRGTPISNKDVIIAIPTSVFMKYQLNPTTAKRKRLQTAKLKALGLSRYQKVTNWSRPK
tara:strand:- start:73 stop:357 length:285 start_codon:yes stop_codon:yes gene_type:complete